MESEKRAKFKRLATLRGNRIIKDLRLLSNLSNRSNYSYNESDVKVIFDSIETELKEAKHSFNKTRSRRIQL